MRTNLQTEDGNGKRILEYIEENASDVLVAKINSGSKTMADCMNFILGEAKKQAQKGCAMIEDSVVYGWAIHFFEEDSIKPEVKAPMPAPKKVEAKAEIKKPKKAEPTDECTKNQMSIFDFIGATP